jgi:hypothetical protein
MRKAGVVATAFFVALGACAGRAPEPVAVVPPQDGNMDCTAITAEIQDNNRRVTELASEKQTNLPEYLIIMDRQGTAAQEVAALQSRQQYLAALVEQRCKPAGPPPAVPRTVPPRPQRP